MKEKIRRVKIETVKGERFLAFKPVSVKDENKCICETDCPYGKDICNLLRNPECPDDPESSFLEFCSNLGDEESQEVMGLECYCPCEGTLEENLYDIDDVYQNLVKKDPVIKISEVIDSVCSDTCPLYKKDHSNCNTKNTMCLLQDIIKRK